MCPLFQKNFVIRSLSKRQRKIQFINKRERGCVLASCGSLTIEAAIVLPLFVLVLAALVFIGQIFLLEMRLQAAMEYAVEYAATLEPIVRSLTQGAEKEGEEKESGESIREQLIAFAGEIAGRFLHNGIVGGGLLWLTIDKAGSDYLTNSGIAGGSGGIAYWRSQLPDDEGIMDFIISYQVKIPLAII